MSFQPETCFSSQIPGACGHSVLNRKKNIMSLYPDRIKTKVYSPLTSDQNTFSNDQTNTTLDTLDVILLHDLAWVGVWSAIPGKRRHHESVLQGDTPDLERSEESFWGHFEYSRKQVLSEEREIWILLAFIVKILCFYIEYWRSRVIWTELNGLVMVQLWCL